MTQINWPIALIAVGFFTAQNRYFGWNALPRSDTELIADGITLVILALAFIKPATVTVINEVAS